MWFFQPRHMTMFDKQARIALSKYIGRAVKPEGFLDAFEKYFEHHRKAIRTALNAFSVRYPYERRVADKHLWLAGSKLTAANIRAAVDSWR
jgi:hypothetical protein